MIRRHGDPQSTGERAPSPALTHDNRPVEHRSLSAAASDTGTNVPDATPLGHEAAPTPIPPGRLDLAPLTYSVADVARILQLSEGTVRQLTHDGRLNRLPIARPWRYSAAELRRFLASQEPARAAASQPDTDQPITAAPYPAITGRRRAPGSRR